MRGEVARDLSDSAYDFKRVVWPAIEGLMQYGRLEPVEAATARDMAQALDVLAGIDAWQMLDAKGVMRGIASRIQWGPESWNTFTIRLDRNNGSKTEYAKRLTAWEEPDAGWLLPHITVQAYLTEPRRGGRLIRAGIVRTRDLLKFSVEHKCPQPRRNGEDGVLFNWYRWSAIRQAGYRVREVAGELSLFDPDGAA